MGCASVKKYLNCVDLDNRFYHPYFDLTTCQLDRCSLDKCNDGGMEMRVSSGGHVTFSFVTTGVVSLLAGLLS